MLQESLRQLGRQMGATTDILRRASQVMTSLRAGKLMSAKWSARLAVISQKIVGHCHWPAARSPQGEEEKGWKKLPRFPASAASDSNKPAPCWPARASWKEPFRQSTHKSHAPGADECAQK
jgi:hypothetical protein